MMAKIKGHKIGIAIVAVLFFGILAIPICVKSKEQNDLSQNEVDDDGNGLPVLVSNKLTYIGVINMKSFKVTVKYEYDKLASY